MCCSNRTFEKVYLLENQQRDRSWGAVHAHLNDAVRFGAPRRLSPPGPFCSSLGYQKRSSTVQMKAPGSCLGLSDLNLGNVFMRGSALGPGRTQNENGISVGEPRR